MSTGSTAPGSVSSAGVLFKQSRLLLAPLKIPYLFSFLFLFPPFPSPPSFSLSLILLLKTQDLKIELHSSLHGNRSSVNVGST